MYYLVRMVLKVMRNIFGNKAIIITAVTKFSVRQFQCHYAQAHDDDFA